MDRRVALIYGKTGQTVEFYPPEVFLGVPSSATSQLWRGGQGNDQTPELTPTVTIDSVNLTTTGAAGMAQHAAAGGRSRIPMTTTTDLVVGRMYLLSNTNGQRETPRLRAVQTNTHADADAELGNDYPTGSTLRGIRMSVAIDDTWAATQSKLNDPSSPYRLELRYTVASVERRHWLYLDLVRAALSTGVTPADIFKRHADLQFVEPKGRTGGVYWRDIIAQAEDVVRRDYKRQGIDPTQVLEGEEHDNLVLLQTLVLGAKDGKVPAGRDVELFKREANGDYWRDLQDVKSRMSVSQNRDGAITDEPSLDLWCKS